MPSDSKKKRYNLRNKNKKDKEKERKNHSDNGDKKPDDEDDEEFNNMDYKRLLQFKLFRKYLYRQRILYVGWFSM